MKDLIERQTVIESIRECAEAAHDNHEWDMEQGYWNAIECIEEEPSEQSEQRWIPCSERLPEHTGTYLVTDIVAVDKYVTTGWYSTKGSWICDGYVEAWMPLPEPYKEK